MSKIVPTRQQTETRRKPGDVVNSWTLLKLMEDGPSSQLRRGRAARTVLRPAAARP